MTEATEATEVSGAETRETHVADHVPVRMDEAAPGEIVIAAARARLVEVLPVEEGTMARRGVVDIDFGN